jgi:drug/metabolite transporter (DMT)-like permease
VGVLSVGLPYVLAAQALRLISSTVYSILMNLIPVFSVLLAHIFLPDERLTARTALGIVAAVAGASLVVWSSSAAASADKPNGAVGLGVLVILGNALTVAVGTILLRRRMVDEDALVVIGGQMVMGLLVVAPVALLVEGVPRLAAIPWQGWAALLWAALVGSFLAYTTYFLMIRRWGVTTPAVARTGIPLAAAVAGWALIGDRITLLVVLGGIVLVGGVLVVLLGGRSDRQGEAVPAPRGEQSVGEVICGTADGIR